MIQVKNAFKEHKEEIEQFYDFLDEVIGHEARLIIDPPIDTVKTIKVETTAIMKSSFFLMLYNCVESTVVNCLTTIIRTIETEGCKYSELTNELQIAYLAACDYLLNDCDSKDQRNVLLKQQADFVAGISTVHLDVKSLVGSSSQGTFSGSLDTREIRKLFGRIGINLDSLRCDEMQKIKDCRNKLAHGECSFQEFGSSATIQYIQVCKNNTLAYLSGLITTVDDFISSKRYYKHPVGEKRNKYVKCIIQGLKSMFG